MVLRCVKKAEDLRCGGANFVQANRVATGSREIRGTLSGVGECALLYRRRYVSECPGGADYATLQPAKPRFASHSGHDCFGTIDSGSRRRVGSLGAPAPGESLRK